MITVLGAIAGFLAVAFGAFGAHALGESLSGKASGWWETATLYLLVHATIPQPASMPRPPIGVIAPNHRGAPSAIA